MKCGSGAEVTAISDCSVTKLCSILCNLMDCSMPGFPAIHQLPEFAQVHVHRIGDVSQCSHSLSPFSFCLQSFPVSGSFPMSWLLHQVAKVLELHHQHQHQSFQWIFMTDWLISLLSKRLSKVFSSTVVQKLQFFDTLPSLGLSW